MLRRLLLRKRIPSGCCELVDEVENVCACAGGWYCWKDWVDISSSGKVFIPFFRDLPCECLAMVCGCYEDGAVIEVVNTLYNVLSHPSVV